MSCQQDVPVQSKAITKAVINFDPPSPEECKALVAEVHALERER